MKTLYANGNLTGHWIYTILPSKQILADQRDTVLSSVPLNSDKVSVNTGYFVPGVYRINPYTVYKESLVSHVDFYRDEMTSPTAYIVTEILGDFSPYFAEVARRVQPGITSNLDNYPSYALQKAYGKVAQGSVNMGETLGEFHQTLNLLRSPFKNLRDFLCNSSYKNLGLWNTINHWAKTGTWAEKGGHVLTGSRAAKVAANTWLEFRYGLMPLILTAQDAIKAINKGLEALDSNKIHTARASVVHEKNVNFGIYSYYGAQIYRTEFFGEFSGTDKITCRGSVQYRLLCAPTIGHIMQLTPRFWPELAWELTRLSFVVDWFFDVSRWLAALRISPEVVILGNTVGRKIERTVSFNANTAVFSTGGLNKTNRGIFPIYKKEYYDRLVNQELPLLPHFQPDVNSILHTVDGLALILQPILGKLR